MTKANGHLSKHNDMHRDITDIIISVRLLVLRFLKMSIWLFDVYIEIFYFPQYILTIL